MNIKLRHLIYLLIAVIDMAIILCSYFLASYLYLGDPLAPGQLVNIRVLSWRDSGILFLFAYSLFLILGYAATRVFGSIYLGRIRRMAKSVLAVNLVGLILFMSSFYIVNLDDASRVLVFLFFVFSTFFVCLANWIAIHLFRLHRNSKKYRRNVLVVGCGHLAEEYAKAVAERSSRPEHVIGYIDPNLNPYLPFDSTQSQKEFLGACLGSVWGIDYVFQSYQVEEIVLALDIEDYACVRQAVAAADKHGVSLTLVPFYNDIIPRKPNIDSFGGINLVDLRSMPLSNPLYASIKRFVDIVVSLIVIILTSWIMIITAIGVKFSSPGPVFFKQLRMGRYNKPFEMLKFRSMAVNDTSDVAWSTNEDPRKTRFGSFIRKYSIDELPQFFNVLKGDMSIVGPRPEIPFYVEQFSQSVPLYMLRHQVRPGITGLAQVKGLRGDTSITDRIENDIYYIQHWSFWLDVKIFFKTLFGGFVNDESLVESNLNKRLANTRFGAFLDSLYSSSSTGVLASTFSAIYLILAFVYVFLTILGDPFQISISGMAISLISHFAIKWIPYVLIAFGLIVWLCEGRKLLFWLIAIASYIIFFAISKNSDISDLMSLCAFVFAYPKSLDLKKAAITVFASSVLAILVLALCSISGVVPDVHRKGSGIIRHSLGFASPNMFAMSVTVCFLPYVYFRLHHWKWFDTVLWLLVCGSVYFIAQGKMAAMLLLFLLLFANVFKNKKAREIAGKMAPWAFVFCFTITAFFILIYSQNPLTPFANTMNKYLSNNPSDFVYVLSNFPLSLIGNNLQNIDFASQPNELSKAILGINCSYLSILLRFGILGTAIMLLPTIWLGFKTNKEKYYSAVFAILSVSVFSIISNDYYNAAQNFCIFIFGFFIARSFSTIKPETEHLEYSLNKNINWVGSKKSQWSDF